MSKQEITALLEDPQRFDEFARAAFNAFAIQQKPYICEDEMSVFLRTAASDLGLSPPDDETVHDVTKDLSGEEEVISLEKFKAFIGDVLRSLIQKAE